MEAVGDSAAMINSDATGFFEDEYGFAYQLDTAAYEDSEEYPSEALLQRIRTWPAGSVANVRGCLDTVANYWWPAEYARSNWSEWERAFLQWEGSSPDQYVRLATGGWSANEALIAALRENHVIWALTFRLATSGGLYLFRVDTVRE